MVLLTAGTFADLPNDCAKVVAYDRTMLRMAFRKPPRVIAGVLALAAAFTTAAPAQDRAGKVAPNPLFRDPIHDGAADPTLIWNRATHEWWMFYTNRRADMATPDIKNVAWVHQTRIGIAVSRDQGATWTYKGTANIPYGTPDYTHWAPDIVYNSERYHMFLSVVPGTFQNWNAPREIVHLSSPDLETWKVESKLDLGSDRVIDASLCHLPDGTWRLWFKNERDLSHIHYADSPDLSTWSVKGAAIADRNSEGPKVFEWHGRYWMIVDMWKGLAVYYSSDAIHWIPDTSVLLQKPGHTAMDRAYGHHADVVVNGGRAFLFYFTHLEGADEIADLPHSAQRSVLHVTELFFADGHLIADRDQPTHVLLGTPR